MTYFVRNGWGVLEFMTCRVLSEGEVQTVQDAQVNLGRWAKYKLPSIFLSSWATEAQEALAGRPWSVGITRVYCVRIAAADHTLQAKQSLAQLNGINTHIFQVLLMVESIELLTIWYAKATREPIEVGSQCGEVGYEEQAISTRFQTPLWTCGPSPPSPTTSSQYILDLFCCISLL